MRTLLLSATLLFSPMALAQDDAAGEEPAAEDGAGEAGEEAPEKPSIPEHDVEVLIETCMPIGLMEECEIDGWIGLCKLEPCDRGWKDGARACKQCILNREKPAEEPEAEPAEEPEAEAEEGKGNGNGNGKGGRRVKKRDCGCNASASPMGALALGLIVPVVARRRQS